MAVSYDYYRIFYYVAKYRSFTRAAAVLLGSQPNITRAMNNLEGQLGCRLFVRSNRGVALTPEGERLFVHVQVAQEQLQAAENELASDKNLQSGQVTVGASETALHFLLLPVLRQFHQTYPGVRIQISNNNTMQAIGALKSGQVELAVVTSPAEVKKPLRKTLLLPFRDILVGGPNFASLAQKPLTPAQLIKQPLICLGRETMTYRLYNDLFARDDLVLQPDVEAATTDQILPMVKNDLGIGILPPEFAAAALARGEVVQIHLTEPLPVRHVCLVEDRSRPLSLAAQRLAEMIRAAGE